MADLSLGVNSFDASSDAWDKFGSSPYLDVQDYDVNYVSDIDRNNNCGLFGFETFADSGEAITSVTLYMYGQGPAPTNFSCWISGVDTGLGPPAVAGWVSVDVSAILTTWAEINAATLLLDRPNTTNLAYCDAAYLYVVYVAGGATINRSLTEGFSIGGIITPQKIAGAVVLNRNLTDYFSLRDIGIRQFEHSIKLLQDNFTLRDIITAQKEAGFVIHNRSVQDQFSFSDVILCFKLGIFYRSLADSLSLQDNITRMKGPAEIDLDFSDDLNFKDDIVKQAIWNKLLDEYFSLAEVYYQNRELNRSLQDYIDFNDAIISSFVPGPLIFNRILSDAFSFTDVFRRQATLNKLLEEALYLVDDVTVSGMTISTIHNLYLVDAYYIKGYFEYEWIGNPQIQDSIARYLTMKKYGQKSRISYSRISADA